MIMIKILFFDIDGTLLELGKKEMHQELIIALNEVKKKGIKIFLATGRPPFVVPKFHGIEFDGVLSFNGSYCFTPNELIYKNPMDKKDIETFVENAKRLNKAVTLAGINKMGCNFDDEILEEYFMIANQHVHVLDEFNNFMEEEIYQMMVATTEDQNELILENTTTLKVARWWDKACDIISCNGHEKTLWVMIQGIIQTLLVRLPLAYIMSVQPNASLTYIGLAAPVATCFGILLNAMYYQKMKRHMA
jgi:hydroxymethylpyrimidine pyrophosphatase-like HAD family hydrolase